MKNPPKGCFFKKRRLRAKIKVIVVPQRPPKEDIPPKKRGCVKLGGLKKNIWGDHKPVIFQKGPILKGKVSIHMNGPPNVVCVNGEMGTQMGGS